MVFVTFKDADAWVPQTEGLESEVHVNAKNYKARELTQRYLHVPLPQISKRAFITSFFRPQGISIVNKGDVIASRGRG
jgi:hypothetical protein